MDLSLVTTLASIFYFAVPIQHVQTSTKLNIFNLPVLPSRGDVLLYKPKYKENVQYKGTTVTIVSGWVLIYLGEDENETPGDWSSICHDGFESGAADVLCHQLRYVGSYGAPLAVDLSTVKNDPEYVRIRDKTNVSLTEIDCRGKNDSRHILYCHHELGPAGEDCSTHQQDVFLACINTRYDEIGTEYDGQIRLIPPKTDINVDDTHNATVITQESMGLVQVYFDPNTAGHDGWGMIHIEGKYTKLDNLYPIADSICRKLGYTSASEKSVGLRSWTSEETEYLTDNRDIILSTKQILCQIQHVDQCLSYCFNASDVSLLFGKEYSIMDTLVLRCTFDSSSMYNSALTEQPGILCMSRTTDPETTVPTVPINATTEPNQVPRKKITEYRELHASYGVPTAIAVVEFVIILGCCCYHRICRRKYKKVDEEEKG